VVLVLQCLDLFICAVSYGRNGALTVTPVLLFCRCSTSIESSVDALEQLLQTTTTELTTELVVASRAADIMLLQQAAEVRDVVEDYLETVSRAAAAAAASAVSVCFRSTARQAILCVCILSADCMHRRLLDGAAVRAADVAGASRLEVLLRLCVLHTPVLPS
jgi:hypothetical protein